MLDTRTVNTMGEYLWLWRGSYWWRAILWLAAMVVVVLASRPVFTPLVLGFCCGWLACRLRGLTGLAVQNEVLEHFIDWPKVQAAAERIDEPKREAGLFQ